MDLLRLCGCILALTVCSAQETGDIKLDRGSDNAGVLLLYLKDSDSWLSVCAYFFSNTEAGVACRQLGYRQGKALPSGAYGNLNWVGSYPRVLNKCRTGQEARLTDCDFDPDAVCSVPGVAYASVYCFNETASPPDVTVRLDADPAYFVGVSVYDVDMWGRVCSTFWDDNDANVVCRQSGYHGGKATFIEGDTTVPFLLSEINCVGNETALSDCPTAPQACENDRSAAVVCYRNEGQGPTFSLIEGHNSNFGKVVFSIDGKQGLVCKSSYHNNNSLTLTRREAYPLCKTMGFTSGDVLTYEVETPGVEAVVLEGIQCTGEEESVFECLFQGWNETTAQCQGQQMGVTLHCYNTVRLSNGLAVAAEKYHIGRVEMFDEGRWYAVCGETFDKTAATVVCREIGFPIAVLLTPDNFYNSYSDGVSSLACSGTETSLSQCSYTLGRCDKYSQQAALLCQQPDAQHNTTMTISGTYNGEIIVNMFGIEGTVCMEGWDDIEATVACKYAGFTSGVVLAGRNRYKPLWAFNFECMGHETRLEECAYQTEFNIADWTCAEDLTSAGVLCFNNTPPEPLVRIQDGASMSEGRVEVFSEPTGWGTICNSDWSITDAKVVCKQLGYADGQTHTSGFSQADNTVSVVLADLQCDGTERTIFECPNGGWAKVSTSCSSHTRDAGVYCYRHISLDPNWNTFGAVLYHDGDRYGLVCGENFDHDDATVVCRELGHSYAKLMSGSAFGPKNHAISMSNVECSGSEASIQDCRSSTENPVCTSGHYASVVCSDYAEEAIGFTKISARNALNLVEISYFLHPGYVCTEDFTDEDAALVCRLDGFTYGYMYKASAAGLESNIRWLNGLACTTGAETSFAQCGRHDWGQIGACNWGAVAAVMCSDNAGDMNFETRLANGTSTVGRLEINIKSTWGTVCGTDLTKNEAAVICRELGYHDGITMAPGQYGAGTGPVHLSGLKCQGDEISIKDCIWSGYGQSSLVCDHTKDAAIRCYSNVRLSGSTTINYGRLEIFDATENDWVAVCDRSQPVSDATILCRQLGYVAGLFQKGSPLGPTNRKIAVKNILCSSETNCTFTKGECASGKYIALYCSETIIVKETVSVRLPLNSFYGPVFINRYGLMGHVCSVGFDDTDAAVICSELGYKSGTALRTYKTDGYPIIQGNLQCSTSEVKVDDCVRNTFADGHDCYDVNTVAAVICSDEGGVTFGTTDVNHAVGEMKTYVEVIANGQRLKVDMKGFDDLDAAVYCESLSFAGGRAFRYGNGNFGVSEITCSGMEESILQCPGVWDPSKTKDQLGELAGVTCTTSVWLQGGDPARYGAVYTSKSVSRGPVCAEDFDEVDAGVACRNLGHDAGLVLCCSPFGSLEDPGILTNVQCEGNEKQFTDCVHDNVTLVHAETCKKHYAAVACYSGSKPADYSLSIDGSSLYTGSLVMRYIDVDGSVCMDGWDDNAAHVACKELGFSRGVAYRATRSDTPSPFWTSEVRCAGSESRLAQCNMTELGKVTACSNTLSHAGVICFNSDGIFYRLGGSGENRYGRVEVSLNGEWRSLCNLYWEDEDTHVLCKMLGFRTGEAYRGALRDRFPGPVWEANFMCDGTEATLNQCVSSGWRVSTVQACAQHQNDAAAFCYRSVKLSTGVGRSTDQGAVLFYYGDKWYTICNKGFTYQSAQVVCRELGFMDGQVQTGSNYGSLVDYPRLSTHTVKCEGDETDVTDCLVEEACDAQDYVSVVCYGFTLTTTAPAPLKEEKLNPVPIIVAVVLFVILIILGAIVLFCMSRRRKARKLERSKEPFDNTIVSEHVDGTVEASNRLHGLVNTPELSRVEYSNNNEDGRINIAHPGYDNPAYNRGGENPQAGPHRSVLRVDTNPYERISDSRTRSRIGASHPYDNLHRSQMEAENSVDKVRGEDDVEREEDTGPDMYISPFAEQGVLESPTDTHPEPKWTGTEGAK